MSCGLIGATSLLLVSYLAVRFLYDHKKLDQIVEGNADVLIESGQVRLERLKQELISPTQLESSARKQGFESLDKVHRCVLKVWRKLNLYRQKGRRRRSSSSGISEPIAKPDGRSGPFAHGSSAGERLTDALPNGSKAPLWP